MRSFFQIFSTTRTLWPLYIAVTLTSVATALLALVTPFLVREATDVIVAAVGGEPTNSQLSPTNSQLSPTTIVLLLALGLLAAEVGNTIVHNIGGYIGDVLSARLRQILSTRYFAKLLSLPQGYFDNQVTGTIIARLDRSITSITSFVQGFANNFFSMVLTVGAVLAVTAYFYFPIAVLLAIVFPIYMWLTALTSSRWQKWEAEKNEQIDAASGRFAEVVGQVKVVKSFVSEIQELALFARRFARTITVTTRQSRWWHLMDIARGLAVNAIFFGIYLLLFRRTLTGDFSIGTMVLLIQLVTMARQPIYLMSYLVDTGQRAVAGSKDYFAVMAQIPEPTANPQLVAAATASGPLSLVDEPPTPLSPGEPVLRLSGVSFTYPGDDQETHEVLHDVSFVAHQGQRIALVGESGGGKSTLVNLILGLYSPTAGTLEVCGHDIAGVPADSLRASVGVVFQEASLFSGSIKENIAYGRPGATDAAVIAAAQKANAHDFIAEFADGYDTIIGERGLRLSGGQKQRVAVARAMLKNAPVLVLDEATSALDTKSERAVQQGLEELMENRTTLIIAHRLSTIADVDTIITLKDGRVDEIGSPAQLATTGGIYSELLAITDKEKLKSFGLQ